MRQNFHVPCIAAELSDRVGRVAQTNNVVLGTGDESEWRELDAQVGSLNHRLLVSLVRDGCTLLATLKFDWIMSPSYAHVAHDLTVPCRLHPKHLHLK